MIYSFEGSHMIPGMLPTLETLEPELTSVVWGRLDQMKVGHNQLFSGAARDAGNTGYTDNLRPGLLLGQITASGKWIQWDPTATDGSQFIRGVLLYSGLHMTRLASNQDRYIGYVLIGGNVKAKGICIASSSTYGIAGNASEFLIRSQMAKNFSFDDDPGDYLTGAIPRYVSKTADYTVLSSDNGTIFDNAGAAGTVIFTLPATATAGLVYEFHCVADQTITVTAGTADTMIAYNDIAADSVSLGTSSEKVGGSFRVRGNGTKWIVTPRLWEAQTVTIAT